jgi:hypothetical protein
VPVHLALSLGWAAVLAPLLPRGAEVPRGSPARWRSRPSICA